jgi:hypothetical protein
MKAAFLHALLFLLGIDFLSAAIPLQLDLSTTHDLTIKPLGQAHFEFTTTGSDPYLLTLPLPENLNPTPFPVLSFESFSLKPIPGIQIFLAPPVSEEHSIRDATIPSSEGWIPFSLDLSCSPHWRKGKQRFRLDFGRRAGLTFQIRALQLRSLTAAEIQQRKNEATKAKEQGQNEAWWQSYLEATFADRISKVVVDHDKVTIHHQVSEPLLLAEIRPWQSLRKIHSQTDLAWSQLIIKGATKTVVPRLPAKTPYDRLHSRWVFFRAAGDSLKLASHAHYSTDQSSATRKTIPIPKPFTKKGLPLTWRPEAMGQLDELGLGHGTINIDLCQLLRVPKDQPALTHRYLGRNFRINRAAVEHLARTLRFAAERHYLMGAIILVSRNPPPELRNVLLHPDYLPNGIYSMANLTSPEATLHYGMIIDFLASHFSCKENGFLHYWIIHNEVDAAWVWTNCGKCGPHTMMDSYVKSMRLVHQTARQYNPQARAFISLTHFWNSRNVHGPAETMYAPRHLLEILAKHSQAEGNFDWGVAYHPYPRNLRNPRVWEDQVAPHFNTDIISYKNLEVLPAFLRQEKFLFEGQLRKIHLTEQGLSNPDNTPEQLQIQAAALAYAMKKVNATEGVEAHILHRWVDHAQEGGLNLGLVQKKPGTLCTAGRKKPSFAVYAAIDTPEEDRTCHFALSLIGAPSWEHLLTAPPPQMTPKGAKSR